MTALLLRRRWIVWALLAAIYLVMLALTFERTDQWFSDSRFYLAWSYRYLGYSEADAAQLTYDYLAGARGLENCTFCWPADYQHSFFHGENGAVVAPRMIYPLLSAPFVALFGGAGMLVVPALAYAAGAVLLIRLASRMWGYWWAIAAGFALLIPAIAFRFAGSAMTDSLALMFNVAGLMFLPLLRQRRRWDVVWFLGILVLNLFTRQFAITVAFGVSLAWLIVALRDRKFGNAWLPFAAGSIVVTGAVTFLQNLYAARLFEGDQLSLIARYQQLALEKFGVNGLVSIPKVLTWQIRVDYHYVRWLDMPLVIVIGAAILAVCWRFRSELSALLAGTGLVTLAMTVIIVDQTYFRYYVPLVPLLILCALALIRDLATGIRPSRSTEAFGAEPARAGRWMRAADFGVPRLAWISVAGLYLVMAFLVGRETLPHGDPLVYVSTLIGLPAVLLLLKVTERRFDLTVGVSAAVAFTLTQTWLTHSLSSTANAVALLFCVAILGLLPGSRITVRHQSAIVITLLIAVAVLTYRVIPLAAAILAVWLIVAIRDRRLGNAWLPAAAGALPALVLGIFLGARPLWGDATLTAYPQGIEEFKRAVFLVAKTAAGDRMLIALAIIAAAAVLASLKAELTWLAVVGTAVAAAVFFALGDPATGTSSLQLVAPVLMMVTAAAVTRYVRADLDQQEPVAPRAEKAHSGLG
ncbi:hypothetical protein [Catelliglobosispora koreensis]|uniref:hypothetical protein n=1 Tax=Catelliglobosispora koreensis TaxID=129052 RepID=UPI00037ECFC9|nr:hypothetical protein [Catelliglobosispora koreensis]